MPSGNSTNSILKQILVELDALLSAQKGGNAQSKAAGNGSNVPTSNIGNIKIDGGNVKTAADSLASISSSIKMLSSLPKKDIDNAANAVDLIMASFSKIKVKKDDVSGLGEVMKAFTQMHDLVDKVSGNFLKMVIKYNPARGAIAGWALGGFYQAFIAGFEKRLGVIAAVTALKKFGGKNSNIGANLAGLSTLMKALLTINWLKLMKVGLAWKMFPADAGKNIANFMEPIIEMIKKMPAALQNKKSMKGMFGTSSSETTQVSNPQIAGFLEVFHALTSITLLQIIKLNIMAKTLDGNKGRKIGSFFASFIKKVTEPGEKKTEAAAHVVKSVSMMFLSLALSLVLITATVALAGWENALIGLGLLGVLVATSVVVIKVLGKHEMKQGAKDSLYTVGSLVMLYMSMAITLAITTAIVKNNDILTIGLGLGLLLVLVAASVGIIKLMSSDKIQHQSKDALKTAGAIVLLLGTMTVVALISVIIGKHVKDVAIGSAVVLGLTLAGVGIIWLMSLIPNEKRKDAMKVAGTIAILLGTMSIIALISVGIGKHIKEAAIGSAVILGLAFAGVFMIKYMAKVQPAQLNASAKTLLAIAALYLVLGFTLRYLMIPAMQEIDKIGAKGIAVGSGIFVGFVVMGVGLIILLSKVKADLKKGLLIAMGIAKVIVALNIGLVLFGKFLESINKVKGEDIAIGSAIMVGMITAVGAACFAAGTLVAGPQAVLYAAGVAALAGISVTIIALSGALTAFVKMIKNVNTLSVQDVKDAKARIVGSGADNPGMIGCIKDMVKGLSKIGFWASVKIKKIAKNLNPLFFGLSKFVDVIQKMATMRMLDHYDEKGHPVYTKMEPSAFTDAATNLSKSFATFLRELSNVFDPEGKTGPTVSQMKSIIKSLNKGGVSQLMTALSSFASTITAFASLRIADKWDANGKPIHYMQLKETDFTSAATTLAKAFSAFLSELNKSLGRESMMIRNTITNLTSKDSSITSLMTAVKNAVTPLATFSSGRLSVNGKIFKTDLTTLTNGAKAMVDPISYVLKNISKMYHSISKRHIKYVCDCMDIVSKSLKKSSGFIKAANELVNGSDSIFKWLNQTTFNEVKMKMYARCMDTLGTSMKKNKPIFSSMPRYINSVASAIRNLDNAIINKNAARIKAINAMSQSFGSLNENIEKLNNEMATSMQLTRQYESMKGISDRNFIINAISYVGKTTEEVGLAVEKAHAENKEAAKEAAKMPKTQTATVSPDYYIAAFVEALNQWNATHKNLTLELSEKGAVAIGTLYGNR